MTKNHWRDEDDRDNRRSRRSSTRDYARNAEQQENDNVSYSDRSYSGQRRGLSYEAYPGPAGYGRGCRENYGQGSYENYGQNQGQSHGQGNYRRAYGGSYSNSYGNNNYRNTGNRENDRGFFDRAADEVSSWFGNEDAEVRRQADKYRGRGPKNYARSDDRIREDVCDRLAADPWIDASEIEVSVNGAEVTLSGQATSREQRRRIEDCAENVSGVSHVQNNTRVNRGDYSSASYGSSLGSSTTGNGSKSSGSTKGMAGSTTGSTSTSGRPSS